MPFSVRPSSFPGRVPTVKHHHGHGFHATSNVVIPQGSVRFAKVLGLAPSGRFGTRTSVVSPGAAESAEDQESVYRLVLGPIRSSRGGSAATYSYGSRAADLPSQVAAASPVLRPAAHSFPCDSRVSEPKAQRRQGASLSAIRLSSWRCRPAVSNTFWTLHAP